MLGSSENKTYPLAYLANVIDTIVLETKANIQLNYIPKQKEQVRELLSYCKPNTQKHIHQTVYGKSLREFMALTANCDALIGNEGRAINMAKALGIPTFAIFSPWISLEAWASYQNNLNVSVHLKNYKPEIYINKNIKELKPESQMLYQEFKSEFFNNKLKEFLKNLD